MMREHHGGGRSPRRDVVGLTEMPVSFATSPGLQRQLCKRTAGLAKSTCLVSLEIASKSFGCSPANDIVGF